MKMMTVTGLLLTGLAAGPCLSVHAAEPQTPAAEATYSGMKVGIDARTGKLRPLSASESRQLDQVLTRGRKPQFAPGLARSFSQPADEAAARMTVRALAGGGVAVKLPESQMSTVSVHRDGSGQLVIEHTNANGDAARHEEPSHE